MAPCSFVVLNLNLKFYFIFGGNYKPPCAQTPQRVGRLSHSLEGMLQGSQPLPPSS